MVTPRGDASTVEFRDAATGVGRATVTVPGKPTSTTWHGRPALVSESVKKTPSDGISPERTAWEVQAFDENGRRIAGKVYAEKDKPRIVDGRRILVEPGTGSGPGTFVVSDAGGEAPGWRIPCQDRVCMHETATVAADIVIQEIRKNNAETLAGFDPATGAVLWGPRTLGRPVGADATAVPGVVEGHSGALIVAWYSGMSGSPQSHTAYSVNDPATGRLLATGPILPGSPKSGVIDTGGAVAVVATTKSAAAWETRTGNLLWNQAEDETRLAPVAIVGPVLYSGKDPSMAVDLRTKAVLQRVVRDAPVPVGAGHAVVTVSASPAYVFAVARG